MWKFGLLVFSRRFNWQNMDNLLGILFHICRCFRRRVLEKLCHGAEHDCSLAIWGFPKIGVLWIIHFNRIFPDKPSILGYPHWWKPPFYIAMFQQRSTASLRYLLFDATVINPSPTIETLCLNWRGKHPIWDTRNPSKSDFVKDTLWKFNITIENGHRNSWLTH